MCRSWNWDLTDHTLSSCVHCSLSLLLLLFSRETQSPAVVIFPDDSLCCAFRHAFLITVFVASSYLSFSSAWTSPAVLLWTGFFFFLFLSCRKLSLIYLCSSYYISIWFEAAHFFVLLRFLIWETEEPPADGWWWCAAFVGPLTPQRVRHTTGAVHAPLGRGRGEISLSLSSLVKAQLFLICASSACLNSLDDWRTLYFLTPK